MIKTLPIWQQNHLNVCIEKNLFKNKNVLEVGGATPYPVTNSLGVKSWTCVDLKLKENIETLDYKRYKASILDFDIYNSYDLIFSTNCFEHIVGLEKAFDQMYNLLAPNGYLTALFGPIWSSAHGHHVYLKNNDKLVTFNDLLLPKWSHLLYNEQEITEILKDNYDIKFIQECISQIFYSDFINRLFYDDYINIINNSKFKILELREWHSPVFPDEKTLKILKDKYNNSNFSTISLKVLLKK